MSIQLHTESSLIRSLGDRGSELRWDDFYQKYESPIIGYVVNSTGDHQIAYDTLQETMLKFLRAFPRFEYDPRRGKFRHYLFTVVHRTMLRQIERQRRLATLTIEEALASIDTEPLVVHDQPPGEAEERQWRRAWLSHLLRERAAADPRIDPANVELFLEHLLEARPAAELAAAYGKTVNRVHGIIHEWKRRAADLVATELDDSEEAPPA